MTHLYPNSANAVFNRLAMRCLALVIGLLLWASACMAQVQDSIPLYADVLARQDAARQSIRRPWLGTDLTQSVWWIGAAFNRSQPRLYSIPLSAILYLPDKRVSPRDIRFTYISAGYMAYSLSMQRNIRQQGNSLHLRAGREHVRNGLLVGFGGIVSTWSGAGSFTFSGPVFGTYEEQIGRSTGISFGAEGYLGYHAPLSKTVAIRSQLRLLLLSRSALTNNSQQSIPLPDRQSGIDAVVSNSAGPGISVSVNLLWGL